MDGWNTCFLLGWPIFRGELLVSGRVPTQTSCTIIFGKSLKITIHLHYLIRPNIGNLMTPVGGLIPKSLTTEVTYFSIISSQPRIGASCCFCFLCRFPSKIPIVVYGFLLICKAPTLNHQQAIGPCWLILKDLL